MKLSTIFLVSGVFFAALGALDYAFPRYTLGQAFDDMKKCTDSGMMPEVKTSFVVERVVGVKCRPLNDQERNQPTK